MIKVDCEVDILELNYKETTDHVLRVTNLGHLTKNVALVLNDLTVVVDAADLCRAIQNATNTGN
jgi:hypothetical protein